MLRHWTNSVARPFGQVAVGGPGCTEGNSVKACTLTGEKSSPLLSPSSRTPAQGTGGCSPKKRKNHRYWHMGVSKGKACCPPIPPLAHTPRQYALHGHTGLLQSVSSTAPWNVTEGEWTWKITQHCSTVFNVKGRYQNKQKNQRQANRNVKE